MKRIITCLLFWCFFLSTSLSFSAVPSLDSSYFDIPLIGYGSMLSEDPSGKIVELKQQDQSSTAIYYDIYNRIVRIMDKNTLSLSLLYDPKQRILHSYARSQLSSYYFTAQNNLAKVILPDQTIFEYHYFVNNQKRSQLITPHGTIHYFYNSQGKLQTLIDPNGYFTSFEYDAKGRRFATLYPNGMKCMYRYDQKDQIIAITYFGPNHTLLASFLYTYHTNGTVSQEITLEGKKQIYYDSKGQVKRVNHPNNTWEQFTYDENQNINWKKGRSNNWTTFGYTNDHLLTSYGKSELTYDIKGNCRMIQEKETIQTTSQYLYDVTNLLKSYTKSYQHPSQQQLQTTRSYEYAFNRQGFLQTKHSPRKTTHYYYDLNQLLYTTNQTGEVESFFIYGPKPKEILYQVGQVGIATYFIRDLFGSTRMLVDNENRIIAKYEYDAFGKITTSNQLLTPFLFRGNHYDPHLKAYLIQGRLYDPKLGRFLSALHTYSSDQNPYSFLKNNPYSLPEKFIQKSNENLSTFPFNENSLQNKSLNTTSLNNQQAMQEQLSSSRNSFQTNSLYATFPSNISCLNGTIQHSSNLSIQIITETYPNKSLETNGDQFILYAENNETLSTSEGVVITYELHNDEPAYLVLDIKSAANPSSEEVTVNDLYWTFND